MPLFLIFHSLYAIGVKNTNGAVKLKDKRTIIPLAHIPCPLSTTTDVWDPHVRFIFNLEPIGSTTATEGPAHAPRPPSGPCCPSAAAAVARAAARAASFATGRTLRRIPAPAPSRAASSAAGRALRAGSLPHLPSPATPSRRRAPPPLPPGGRVRPSSLAAGRAPRRRAGGRAVGRASAPLLPRRWASSRRRAGRRAAGRVSAPLLPPR